MTVRGILMACAVALGALVSSSSAAQEKKLERIRVGGGIPGLLQDLERSVPKAKGAKVEDFVDSRFVPELEQSGFIKSALAGR